MNAVDILLILMIAAAVVLAVRKLVRDKKRGKSCCGDCAGCVKHEEAVKRVSVTDRNRDHYPYAAELTIEGMTCENCARRVENALNSIDGVWAKVDIGSRRATVQLKKPPEERELSRAVRDAGYVVSSVK